MLKEFGFQMPLTQGARMRSEEMVLVFPTMFRANNVQTDRVGYDDNHLWWYDDMMIIIYDIMIIAILQH